jgi:hypothetical protein
MRNIEKVRRSAAPNLLVQFPLAELTLQLAVDPSKSRRSIPVRADGRSQQKPMVDPSKSRRLIPTVRAGRTERLGSVCLVRWLIRMCHIGVVRAGHAGAPRIDLSGLGDRPPGQSPG